MPIFSAGKLNLYCSAEIDWCQLMAVEFEKTSGIKVFMTRASSGETYAKINAEKKNPKDDIWWGGTGDPHLQAAQEGLTVRYKSKNLSPLQNWAVRQAEGSGYKTVGLQGFNFSFLQYLFSGFEGAQFGIGWGGFLSIIGAVGYSACALAN